MKQFDVLTKVPAIPDVLIEDEQKYDISLNVDRNYDVTLAPHDSYEVVLHFGTKECQLIVENIPVHKLISMEDFIAIATTVDNLAEHKTTDLSSHMHIASEFGAVLKTAQEQIGDIVCIEVGVTTSAQKTAPGVEDGIELSSGTVGLSFSYSAGTVDAPIGILAGDLPIATRRKRMLSDLSGVTLQESGQWDMQEFFYITTE